MGFLTKFLFSVKIRLKRFPSIVYEQDAGRTPQRSRNIRSLTGW